MTSLFRATFLSNRDLLFISLLYFLGGQSYKKDSEARRTF